MAPKNGCNNDHVSSSLNRTLPFVTLFYTWMMGNNKLTNGPIIMLQTREKIIFSCD